MRVDKWLWAAEFFRARGQAQTAIDGGRVVVNGERCKTGHELQVGDKLQFTIGEYAWDITVLSVAEPQIPGGDGRDLYEEDEDSLARRAQAIEAKKLESGIHTRERSGDTAPDGAQRRDRGRGRPGPGGRPGQGRPKRQGPRHAHQGNPNQGHRPRPQGAAPEHGQGPAGAQTPDGSGNAQPSGSRRRRNRRRFRGGGRNTGGGNNSGSGGGSESGGGSGGGSEG